MSLSVDDKIDQLSATINGQDGVLVRLAVAEHTLRALSVQVGRIETEILEHRRSSNDAHKQTLAAIKDATPNATQTKWMAGLIVAVMSAFGGFGGFTVVHAVTPSATGGVEAAQNP